MEQKSKLTRLLQSRKFWAMITATALVVTGYMTGGLTIQEAIIAQIGNLAAYMVGTGLDDSGQASADLARLIGKK